MSHTAKIIEKAFRLAGMRLAMSKLISNPKRSDALDEPPSCLYRKYVINCVEIRGRKCFSLKSSANPVKHIFYFHGGAYTLQAQKIHWRIIAGIMAGMPCEVSFINYPLAPESTCRDTIGMAVEAYSFLSQKSGQEIILMGDSAGGGLALALAQFVKRQGLQPKPDKIVLLSPWLDISMAAYISEEQEKNDLMLAKDTLLEAGQRYAGEYGLQHYLCSPLYGDVKGVGDIALFTGTSDLLHVQALQLRDKCDRCGQVIAFYEYAKMQHVWIGFPMPEAKKAMDQVISFIHQDNAGRQAADAPQKGDRALKEI